jgi:hypothetical protein
MFVGISMKSFVSQMVQGNYQLGDEAGYSNLDSLKSEATTLVEGGLIDTNWNGGIYPEIFSTWAPPHCGHRDGRTIDLSINFRFAFRDDDFFRVMSHE